MKKVYTLLLFSLIAHLAQAQTFTINTETAESLNDLRIKTNKTGMTVLGSWAAANIVYGTAGAFIAKDEEWKAFHGMNALWNTVNGVIAVTGYLGAKKEMREDLSYGDMLSRYEGNKRMFLLNAGLDVAYIAGGVILNEYADEFKNPAKWHGFGKSIALQGIFLLIFDGTMFTLHQQQNKKWYKLIAGIRPSANGIGYCYTF